MYIEELFNGYSLTCELVKMGSDYTLAVYGGGAPHVGSVVLAEARPSLTGEGLGVTSSVLNRTGHKDESVARVFAEAVAVRMKCSVVCVCGIHIDAITPEQIAQVQEAGKKLLDRVLASLEE